MSNDEIKNKKKVKKGMSFKKKIKRWNQKQNKNKKEYQPALNFQTRDPGH
jgi:hypothetical protein